MDQNIKVNLKMTKCKEMVFYFMLMEKNIKDNLKTKKQMDMVLIIFKIA